MARHKANHIQVAYAPDAMGANRALASKAAAFEELGIRVSVCGSGHGLDARDGVVDQVDVEMAGKH
jgi:hypothetical protein